MILEIPFPYAADVMRRFRRRPERVTLIGRVQVRIREVDGSAAPVAVRAMTSPPFPGAPAGQVREYRDLGGRLVGPLLLDIGGMPGGAGPDRAPVAAERAQAAFDAWARNALAARGRAGPAEFALLGEREIVHCCEDERAVMARRVDPIDRAERAARIRDALARSAFVDGVLHVPSSGPGYHVVGQLVLGPYPPPPGQETRFAVGVRVVDDIGRARRAAIDGAEETVFRADRLEAALEAARRLAARRGMPVAPLDGRIEILDASCLGHDDRGQPLRAAAEALLAGTAADLARLGTAGIRAYADLRDQLDAARGRPFDEAEAEAVLMTMRDLEESRAPRRAPPVPAARWPGRSGAPARGRDPEAGGAEDCGTDDLRRMGL